MCGDHFLAFGTPSNSKETSGQSLQIKRIILSAEIGFGEWNEGIFSQQRPHSLTNPFCAGCLVDEWWGTRKELYLHRESARRSNRLRNARIAGFAKK